MVPIYQSTITLIVNQNTPTQTLDTSVLSVSEQLAETFIQVAKTKPVLDEVSQTLAIDPINDKDIDIALVPRTQLFKISAKAHSPEQAAQIANGIASVLKKKVADLQSSINPNSRAVIDVVESAVPDSKPFFPKIKLSLALGFILSVMLGVFLIYMVEYFNNTITSEEDIIKVAPEIPIIGTIPLNKNKNKQDALIEAFRELRNNFYFLRPDNPIKIVAITSANDREGKTFVSLELANTLARAEKDILLIDTDLRRAGLSRKLGFKNQVGLAEMLFMGKPLAEAEVKTSVNNHLHILNAGKSVHNPGEIFSSKRADVFFKSLRDSKKYDYIILDTPPVQVLAETTTVVTKSDGVLYVIEANRSTTLQLKNVKDSLKSVKADLLGIILNKAKVHHHGYEYGQYK